MRNIFLKNLPLPNRITKAWKPLFCFSLAFGVGFSGVIHAEMIQTAVCSFFLTPPLGWVLDQSIASQEEAEAVLYPQGTTYKEAPSVLFVSVAEKGGGFKDLKDLLKQDREWALQENPHFKLQTGPLLQTRLKRKEPLYFYLGLKDGEGDAVAYVEEEQAVILFTLSSSNEKILREDLPALQELVDSYEFAGKGQEDLE